MNSGANSLASNFNVTRVKIWENEMLWGHEPQCFYRFFSHECFYNSIETRRTCFPFSLENTATNKKENNALTLIIQMSVILASAIITSTACANSVSR